KEKKENIYLIKKFIDKIIDLEVLLDDPFGNHNYKLKLIHLICKYCNYEIIKYIIDKNVDLDCTGLYNWKPIHYICRYQNYKSIKYIIDKNVDLECTGLYNWKPIHFV